MSKSFLQFMAEDNMMGYVPNQRAAMMQTRAAKNMARDERRQATAGDSPTKSIDIQIASLKDKLARLQERRYKLLRAKQGPQGNQPQPQQPQDQGMVAGAGAPMQ